MRCWVAQISKFWNEKALPAFFRQSNPQKARNMLFPNIKENIYCAKVFRTVHRQRKENPETRDDARAETAPLNPSRRTERIGVPGSPRCSIWSTAYPSSNTWRSYQHGSRESD